MPVAAGAPSKPLPQATIKLQPAPAPATAAKTGIPAAKPAAPAPAVAPAQPASPFKKAPSLEKAALTTDDEEDVSDGVDLPMPIAIGALVLSMAALGIQIWTFMTPEVLPPH
jgi:hypothetical protein